MPRQVHRSESLSTRADGGLTLAVVADTHSAPHPRRFELIRALKPDAILHAGDIGELQVLEELRVIAPFIAVRGNIDNRADAVPDVVTLSLESAGSTVQQLMLTLIAVAGINVRADAARLARAEKASLIVCGHSHVPFITESRGLTLFNPGSIGPRRFTLPIVFGVIEVTPTRVDLRHVSCETGRDWLP